MRFNKNNMVFIILMLLCLTIIACEEKKEGKVNVIDQAFTVRQDSEYAYVIDARGTVKNVGEVDVKSIVVTGNCSSCGTTLTAGAWMISPDVDKTEELRNII